MWCWWPCSDPRRNGALGAAGQLPEPPGARRSCGETGGDRAEVSAITARSLTRCVSSQAVPGAVGMRLGIGRRPAQLRPLDPHATHRRVDQQSAVGTRRARRGVSTGSCTGGRRSVLGGVAQRCPIVRQRRARRPRTDEPQPGRPPSPPMQSRCRSRRPPLWSLIRQPLTERSQVALAPRNRPPGTPPPGQRSQLRAAGVRSVTQGLRHGTSDLITEHSELLPGARHRSRRAVNCRPEPTPEPSSAQRGDCSVEVARPGPRGPAFSLGMTLRPMLGW